MNVDLRLMKSVSVGDRRLEFARVWTNRVQVFARAGVDDENLTGRRVNVEFRRIVVAVRHQTVQQLIAKKEY